MILPSKLNERGVTKRIRRTVNQVIDHIKSLRIASSPDIAVKRTATGTSLTLTGTGGGGGGARTIQRFKITAISDDWFTCRKIDKDEAETSSTDFTVMRPPKLRQDQGLPSDFKAGTLVNADSQNRTYDRTISATDYTVAEEIKPQYAVGDFIYGANKITGGTIDDGTGNKQLEWIDLNVDGRHWSWSAREIEVCVNDAIKKAIAAISEGED